MKVYGSILVAALGFGLLVGQAQADALKQIAEAQNRKQDTRQEAMVRHLADISRAVQNGGIIAQVVP